MRTDKNQSYFSINNIPVTVLLTEGWEQKLWLVIFGEKKNKKFYWEQQKLTSQHAKVSWLKASNRKIQFKKLIWSFETKALQLVFCFVFPHIHIINLLLFLFVK